MVSGRRVNIVSAPSPRTSNHDIWCIVVHFSCIVDRCQSAIRHVDCTCGWLCTDGDSCRGDRICCTPGHKRRKCRHRKPTPVLFVRPFHPRYDFVTGGDPFGKPKRHPAVPRQQPPPQKRGSDRVLTPTNQRALDSYKQKRSQYVTGLATAAPLQQAPGSVEQLLNAAEACRRPAS